MFLSSKGFLLFMFIRCRLVDSIGWDYALPCGGTGSTAEMRTGVHDIFHTWYACCLV